MNIAGTTLGCILALTSAAAGAEVLVGKGAVWSYLDNGSDQGTAWRSPGFNEAGWKTGPAQLGYGDGDEATVIGYGPNSASKYITSYFRRHFTVADPSALTSLKLNVQRDDGAVVYLNGTEVRRENMPTGTIGYTTPASANTTSETTFFSSTLPVSQLVAGDNVVAVEIHQVNGSSSDLSFDLELIGTGAVVRGPYLQMAAANGIVVRWRTVTPTDSRVRFGTVQGALNLTADNPTVTTEHEVRLTGLSPETRYYYSVGSTTGTQAGGDATAFFATGPAAGTARPTRIWVIGDAGTANANQAAVYSAYRRFTGTTPTNLWLMLGDNAYNDGTDSEFQAAVFDMYPDLLRQAPVWPTLGNHDGHTADSATQTGAYYDIFTLPKNGEAGGVASGTEAYYSFNYGNIHFVVLDSYETDRSTGGAMMSWLAADLLAARADWLIAFWHHPPYSKGSHDSDTEAELVQMRQNFLPVLEQYGVDLVLTGHSHSYERSRFIDGHYGVSSTFGGSYVVQPGSGRTDDTGAYSKAAGGAAHAGAVYAVAGSSGQTSGGTLNHPAMYLSLNALGSMVLDVDGLTLNARFLDNAGTVRDYFTLVKTATTACTLPWGGTLASGQSVSAFQASVSTTCVSETRTCTNGTLSGSYVYPSCSAPPSNVTVSLQNGVNGYSGNDDSYVASKIATTNYGGSAVLYADGSDSAMGRAMSLLKWNVGGIPAGATVDSASLALTLSDASAGTYNVYALTGTWAESTVTWSSLNPTTKLGTLIGTLPAGSTGARQIALNGAGVALVQGWIRGTSANNGIVIVDGGTTDGIDIRSSEYATVSARPKLTLTYH